MEVIGNNISMIRGDTEAIRVSVKDADGNPVALAAGDTVYFTVKTSTETEEKMLQKEITTFDNGEALITIFPEDTKTFSTTNAYCYDIQLTRSNGQVKTIVPPSRFFVRGEVTYE